jgi:hypothetical protein
MPPTTITELVLVGVVFDAAAVTAVPVVWTEVTEAGPVAVEVEETMGVIVTIQFESQSKAC